MKFNKAELQAGAERFSNTCRKPSVLVLLFSLCFAFWFVDLWRPFNKQKGDHNFKYDVFGYYSYLPSIFCNNGSMEFNTPLDGHNPYGPLGTHVPKYTYGMSVMYAPFFALGYKVAINQKDALTGFTEGFATCIRWGSIFYVLLGLFFLRKFLLDYFDEKITALTLAVCLFGSLLFYYTYVQSEMTHSYLAALFCIFLYLSNKWHKKVNYSSTIWLGLVLGLIVLIRPTEIFVLMYFLLWNVRKVADLKVKFRFLLSNYKHLLLIALIAVLWWIPQLIYYKQHAGSYFYFSYINEKFFWNDPQVINILFSYRKGWFTYTPVIALAFAGMFFIKREFPLSGWSFFLITSFMVYVLSCWWDWGFGGCFGARSFCQQIVLLSVPLASFFEFVYRSEKRFVLKPLLVLGTSVYLCSSICLNIGQSYQYNTNNKIHYWGTTKKIYWDVIRTYQFSEEYNYQWWKDLKEPDFEKYGAGERDQ